MGAFAGRGETWEGAKKSYNMSQDHSVPDILTCNSAGMLEGWALRNFGFRIADFEFGTESQLQMRKNRNPKFEIPLLIADWGLVASG